MRPRSRLRAGVLLAGAFLAVMRGGEAFAAGPKSAGATVIVDDLHGGAAGSVRATGGVMELDGSIVPPGTLFSELLPNTTGEFGYFSRLVASATLVSPQQVHVTSISFSWNNAVPPNPDGSLYRIEVSTASDFSGVVSSSDSFGFSAAVTAPALSPNTTYYARHKVGYIEGDDTPYFNAGSTITLVREPALAGVTFQFVGLSTMTVSWSANGNPLGITTYTVVLSTVSFYPNTATNTVVITTVPAGVLPTATTTGLLVSTTYFLFVRAVNISGVPTDFAALGSTTTLTPPDTSSPTITNNQLGDNVWRSVNNGSYDVDFNDLGGARLFRFQVKASTVPAGAGPDLIAFTNVITNINVNSYATNWGLPAAVFTALWESATNYISVRVEDNAGNSAVLGDAFYVRKDTTAPVFVDNQPGDNVIRSAGGTLYDVDFIDPRSGLDTLQYSASLNPGSADASVIAWTNIALGGGATEYLTNWIVNFNALTNNATNYISVRAWDIAGATQTLIDPFYVLKDTGGPVVAITVPNSAFRGSLGVVQGTASDFSGVQGTEISIQQAGPPNLYWDGTGFVSAGQIFLPAAGTTAWSTAAPVGYVNGDAYQIVARSSDVAGNYSVPYATANFTLDTSTPTVGVASPASGSTISSLVTITGTAADPAPTNSGISLLEVRLRRNPDGLWWNFFTDSWGAVPVSTQPVGTGAWTLASSPLLRANLADQTSYYIAVRALDNAVPPNTGDFFSLGSSTFTFQDITPPAAVTDLFASTGPLPSSIQLSWTAPGDDGLSGIILAGEFRVHYATFTPFVGPSTSAAQVVLATGSVIPGTARAAVLTALPPGTTHYLYLFTRDDAGNWSSLSNGATAMATPAPVNAITGHVMKVSSEGITAVLVEAFDGSGGLVSSTFTVADGSGSYTLGGLAAGTYRVQASWTVNGITSSVWQDSIVMGSFAVDFVLNLNYTLSTLQGLLQTISIAAAKPLLSVGAYSPAAAPGYTPQLQGARVELFQSGRKVAEVGVGPTGRWIISNLLPGRYAVRAFNGFEFTESQDVDLGEGEVKDVGFSFNPLPEDAVFAFPNPARHAVTLRFESSLAPIEAQIGIFDVAGALVREIPGSDMSSPAPGLYHAPWDLRNSRGEPVASGVYLFMVKVRGGLEGQTAKVIKKVAVVK